MGDLMDGLVHYIMPEHPQTRSDARAHLDGVFSPDGDHVATDVDGGVRIVGLRDDTDTTIRAWRAQVRVAGFALTAIPTLLLVRRDRHGASHLSIWTPARGCRDLGARFDGDVDAWWCSDGRVLVRGLGDLAGMWVVDPAAGAVVTA